MKRMKIYDQEASQYKKLREEHEFWERTYTELGDAYTKLAELHEKLANIKKKGKGGFIMSKHTKEPWRVTKATIYSNGFCVADVYGESFDHAQINAERIVACVNACEGINPKAVPEMMAELRLLILNFCAQCLRGMSCTGSCGYVKEAEQAIARAESEE